MKDEVLLSITRHCLQIVDKLPGILVNSVLLARREVESWLETFPRIPPSPEVEQAETGEDTEGGDDDVAITISAVFLQTSVKINQKTVAGPDGGRWDQMKWKRGFKIEYKQTVEVKQFSISEFATLLASSPMSVSGDSVHT